MLEHCPAVLYSCGPGPDCPTTYISHNVTELLGYTPLDFYDDPFLWTRRLHPDDSALVLAELQRIEEVDHLAYEYRVRHRDGHYVWLHDELSAVREPDGRVSMLVGSWVDVSERRCFDDALRESEAKYQDLYNNAPDMFASVDAGTGGIIECNNTLAQATGFSRKEIIGRKILDMYHPDCAEPARAAFDRFVRTGSVRNAELQLRRKNGDRIPVSLNVSAIRDDAGKILYSRSIWRDITVRKQAEARTRERARLMEFASDIRSAPGQERTLPEIMQHCVEALVQHLDAAFGRIWLLNKSGTVLELRASAGMYTHIDGPHGRIPIGELKIGQIAKERKPLLTNAVCDDPRINDHAWAKREGMVAFAGYPLIIGKNLLGVLAMFSREPLTETSQQALSAAADVIALAVERSRFKEAARRDDRLRSIGTLAAGIAHEVNNPITAILLAAQSALDSIDKHGATKQIRDRIEGIVADVERCTRIVESVQQFAKDGTAKKWSAGLDLVIDRAVDLARRTAEQNETRLHVDISEDLPRAIVNPGQMEQALFNLIRNAIQAGARGGKVSIRARYASGIVRIRIRDDGRGMTDEQKSRLFDPFYTTREREGGSGLGLSIAHGIIESHGGTIDVQSELGRGTTVTIEMPLEG